MHKFWQMAIQQRWLYLMSTPFIIWVFVFNYLPLWGWTYAFQNYKPHLSFFDRNGSGLDALYAVCSQTINFISAEKYAGDELSRLDCWIYDPDYLCPAAE